MKLVGMKPQVYSLWAYCRGIRRGIHFKKPLWFGFGRTVLWQHPHTHTLEESNNNYAIMWVSNNNCAIVHVHNAKRCTHKPQQPQIARLHESLRTWQSENMRVWEHESLRTWESGNMRVWKYESLRTWESENMRVWEHESLGICVLV